MTVARGFVLAALLFVGGLVAFGLYDRFKAHPSAPPMAPRAQQADLLVIEKSARRLTAYRDDVVLLEFAIALGFAPTADKLHEGDGKTPEGTFRVDRRNPHSAYHLSIGIDYPQASDIALAKAAGVDPGGDIFIHGQPNGLGRIVSLPWDWTAGCIAVSDNEIEELWRIAPIGTTVEIRP